MTPSKEAHSAYTVRISRDEDGPDADLRRLETYIQSILTHFSVAKADVDVAMVDDEGIRRVHEQFLHDAATTDVISFDLSDDPAGAERSFEIVVNASLAGRESAARGHSLESELALYITHGMLHNLGYDDAAPEQAAAMHKKEDELLEAGGWGRVFHH